MNLYRVISMKQKVVFVIADSMREAIGRFNSHDESSSDMVESIRMLAQEDAILFPEREDS